MLIVVDVILSSLLGKGDSFNVFAVNDIFNKFEFIAPEFLLIELEKHIEEICKRSRLSKKEFNDVLDFVLRQVTFIPKLQFSDCLSEAKSILPPKHLKDVQYLALALKVNCPILSGDKGLKEQVKVKVLSPTGALLLLYGSR